MPISRACPVLETVLTCSVIRSPGRMPRLPGSGTELVNSPVEVIVDGKPAVVLAAVGFPGAVDGYQVNFRLASDTPKGIATIQLSAAWISSAPVKIPVQ